MCAPARKTNHIDWLLGQVQVSLCMTTPLSRTGPSASALHLRPPRRDRKSRHPWTCTPRVFLASALPAPAHPGAWQVLGGFRELHPTLVLGLQIQVLFPRKNQFLLAKNAAPSPTHTEAVVQIPEGMRHRICDLGQVTFRTQKCEKEIWSGAGDRQIRWLLRSRETWGSASHRQVHPGEGRAVLRESPFSHLEAKCWSQESSHCGWANCSHKRSFPGAKKQFWNIQVNPGR